MIRRLVPTLVLVAALSLASCGADEQARPALWRVSDGDTEIWLLGTIHALPRGVEWRTAAVRDAIAGADTLVTEIPADDADRMAATFLRHARSAGLPPLADRVAPGRRVALAPFGKTLDGMKSWAAAVTIGARGIQASGASSAYGVEAVLAQAFAGRAHLALETQDAQLAMFDGLPEAAQRVLLAQAIDDPAAYARELAAWRAGDVDALAAGLAPGFRAAPVLREVLVTRRNARWAGWIARALGQPGRVLVAVGAGHLVGPGSVVAMLRARGVRVERVQ